MMDTDLTSLLNDRLTSISVPPGDVDRARHEGRARRRRRQAGLGVGVGVLSAAVVATLVGVGMPASDRDGRSDRATDTYASVGPLDLSQGARAYANPGRRINLGGRSFLDGDLPDLDTDAVATSYGIVFFDAGRPLLLDADGDVVALVDGPLSESSDFRPTAKADSTTPTVAWATSSEGVTTITLHDLDSGEDVTSTEAPCGSCDDLVIDALDDGVVFVRTDEGTRTWDSATGTWDDLGGPGTRVADVRGGVVLFDGAAPDGPAAADWRLVRGAVDAQLTFDGGHVLSWAKRLAPTRAGSAPVVLDVPGEGLAFYAVDSDGSILVANQEGAYPNYVVYDCEVPSGRCSVLGPLRASSGDPLFIGTDM